MHWIIIELTDSTEFTWICQRQVPSKLKEIQLHSQKNSNLWNAVNSSYCFLFCVHSHHLHVI